MSTRSLLVSGVSGYCGGTILAAIIKSELIAKDLSISGLVRTKGQQAAMVDLGITPILFDDWNQHERLENIAEGFDIIIHAGAGWHPGAARALIMGQGKRRAQNGCKVHYLHLSGTTSLSDYPHTEGWIESRTFSDKEDIYTYLKARESAKQYPVRETDIAVVEEGEAQGVDTYVVMAPTIFGLGTGLFNVYSIQIPVMIQEALQSGQVSVIGRGETVWSHIHVQDLALLFVAMVRSILEGTSIPSGKSGIYFSETGTHTHIELAQRLAEAGKGLGFLDTDLVKSVNLQEAAELWSNGVAFHAELAYGSNARTIAVLGRKLGWVPQHGAKWESTFREEIAAIAVHPPRSFVVPDNMKQ
ncbi:NAD dependent epimerase/dehydratase family protein [Thelonectria olida]|uniref:NAD dependent epimerase/dehydratase family protein n=1 Tax=Thelonectria olida TaxID=1576542 RepID=A0A9P8W1R7_9HYPO|nr:NAD dependent epimerase/dehydratase family protein [Thelonectria olida]